MYSVNVTQHGRSVNFEPHRDGWIATCLTHGGWRVMTDDEMAEAEGDIRKVRCCYRCDHGVSVPQAPHAA